MSEPTPISPPDRLDSWKAIAEYLDRDVATLRRWEKRLGLPVRRIPGGRGGSVFAYASEIDTWMKAHPPGETPEAAEAAVGVPAPVAPAPALWRWRAGPIATLALLVLVVAVALLWRERLSGARELPSRVQMTPTGFVALDSSGREQWRYGFPPEDRKVLAPDYGEPQILRGSNPGVLAATAYHQRAADSALTGGRLLWLTPEGALARAFSFDDRVTFGEATYSPPWVISDFRVAEGGAGRRIAVAAHHENWWPSLVTVLDDAGQRHGTFVNAGWVDRVHWLSPDRLLVSGFSNDRDAGMVAILDARALDGQSPVVDATTFACHGCGAGAPLRYLILPRSEVNRASASTFNRALVEVKDGGIIARTIESARVAEAVEAFYEFTPSLDLVRASYGDRYWEMHRALEAEKKLTHTREQCPDREGPRAILAWEPGSGWRTIGRGQAPRRASR